MSIPRFLLLGLAVSFTTGLKAEDKPVQESTVRFMTYNACRGGTYQGQPLSQSANMIELAKADIVGLQEIGANLPDLAKLLGWNHSGRFITRYDIVEHVKGMGKRPASSRMKTMKTKTKKI